MTHKTWIIPLLILTLTSACQTATQTALPTSTLQPAQGGASSATPSPKLTTAPSSPPATAAPTATVTLPPAPRDFTEDFNGATPYWTVQQIDNGNPFTGPSEEAGFLVFDLNAPNQWVYDFYNVEDYQDVRVDAQVEVRAGDAATGVLCRYSDNGWYEFSIYSDQTYMILFGQWVSSGVAKFTPLFHGGSEKIQSGANQIGLTCSGDILTPYINGVQMRKWEETKFNLTKGGIGISVAAFDKAPATAAFDWVKVSQP
jgi:hypothetical protein